MKPVLDAVSLADRVQEIMADNDARHYLVFGCDNNDNWFMRGNRRLTDEEVVAAENLLHLLIARV